jgi:aminoglycoside phosphotransferase (APT) family kinase protein
VTHDHYSHGWLPVVLPATARRFRVADESLAGVLADAGAELVDEDAEVEIADAPEGVRGDAPLAIVAVEPPVRGVGPLLVRGGSRLASSVRTRSRAAAAAKALRALGYDATPLLWDVAHRAALPGFPKSPRALSERLPERALVVGRRQSPAPTSLEASLAAAGTEAGMELRPRWVSIRSGTAVVATDEAVLRLAIGRGRLQIENQYAALEALRRGEPPPLVAARIPWLLAYGETGLVRWSLERLLPGSRPPRGMTPALLDECVDFLVALHGATSGAEAGPSLVEHAETIAAMASPDAGRTVRTLAESLERELAGMPRGFGHGDFFAGNFLSEEGHLTGVLDWDGGGPGRPPLVDLLHLQLTRAPYGGDDEWGRALLERLLPGARAGGDEPVRRYCREIGVEPDPRLLEAVAIAYWLEYASYQLRTHLDRRSQPAWLEGNIELVARELVRVRRRTHAASARAGEMHER